MRSIHFSVPNRVWKWLERNKQHSLRVQRPVWKSRKVVEGLVHVWQGRRFFLDFDGAFRSALVFCNGNFIGRNDNAATRHSVSI